MLFPAQRQWFTIGRIQKLIVDQHTGGLKMDPQVLTQQAGLYTESYDDRHNLIITFKEEGANGHVGDAALIILAMSCNISDVLENNNVILRFDGNSALYVILTFRDETEATLFCKSFRSYFNPNIAIPISPMVQQVLLETYM